MQWYHTSDEHKRGYNHDITSLYDVNSKPADMLPGFLSAEEQFGCRARAAFGRVPGGDNLNRIYSTLYKSAQRRRWRQRVCVCVCRRQQRATDCRTMRCGFCSSLSKHVCYSAASSVWFAHPGWMGLCKYTNRYLTKSLSLREERNKKRYSLHSQKSDAKTNMQGGTRCYVEWEEGGYGDDIMSQSWNKNRSFDQEAAVVT